MDDTFELLEQKVRRAADLVKKLRRDNRNLEEEATKARSRLQDAEKRVQALEQQLADSNGADPEQLKSLQADLKGLRAEREEVRKRISKLMDLLEGLD